MTGHEVKFQFLSNIDNDENIVKRQQIRVLDFFLFDFTHYAGVSIADFEQVSIGWDRF